MRLDAIDGEPNLDQQNHTKSVCQCLQNTAYLCHYVYWVCLLFMLRVYLSALHVVWVDVFAWYALFMNVYFVWLFVE